MIRKRQGWYAVKEVPAALRKLLGRRLTLTLGTRDLALARTRRHAALAKLDARIEQARRELAGDPLMATAMVLRANLLDAEYEGGGDADDYHTQAVRDAIYEYGERLAAEGAAEQAQAFDAMATGRAVPLSYYIETWLAEGGTKGQLAERTKIEHRKAVKDLVAWLGKQRLGPTVEAVDRRVAGRYVSDALLPSGRHPRTIAKTVHTLSAYWKWLRKRGLADDAGRIPWEGQAPSAPALDSTRDGAERAFTPGEMRRLLASPPDTTMGDFMRVAALSGMRREEIARLTVKDCAGGVFVVQEGKTASARRRVPVHPDLAGIVAERSKGKPASAYLFHELEAAGTERSDPIGKRFATYRRRLGIQDGKGRRSLVSFHSFRRWFVTEALNAGQAPHVVSLVAGHREGRKGVTMTAYWRGAEDAALRACVEAVQLPEPT